MAATQIHGEKQIQTATLTNDRLVNLTLTNAKIAAAAAIDFSKLAALTSGNILVGNGSNVAVSVSVTGDVTISNTGVTAISAGSIVNADINAAAAIDFSKLAALPSAQLLVGNGSNVATATTITGDVTISNAGVTAISSGVIVDADINASAAISLSKLAEAVIQADGGQAFTADQSMGGFKLTSLANGTIATDAVNKGQLDAATAGLSWKSPVTLATTAVLSGTMVADNTSPATGERAYNTTAKTITWFASEGPTTIDGVTLSNGMRIMVKDETATSGPSSGEGRKYNGIYSRTSLDVWTRSSDNDTSAEMEGAAAFAQQGTLNANKGYTQTTDSVTLDTSNIVWVQFTSTNGDATTLDGLDSLQFLRSDANDSVTTGVTLNIDSGATLSIDGTWDISGTAVTATAAELNLLSGKTGTVWTSTNDGAGSGLDADLLDALSSADFLRATASSSLATSNTLTITSGAFINFAVETGLRIGGTSLTTTISELNLVGSFATREVPTGTVDGVNDTFTLASTPFAGTEEVYVNGLQQDAGGANDYTISGAVITFNAGAIPQSGSKIRVSYRF